MLSDYIWSGILSDNVKMRKLFKEKVIKLVDSGLQNLWEHFNDGF